MNSKSRFKYLITVFYFLVSSAITAQYYSPIIYDKEQSQFFGAYNLIATHQMLYSIEDQYLPDTLFRENNFLKKSAGFASRMAKLVLLDGQVDGFVALTQHEVFGHGSRYRELGFEKNSYNLNLWPPFGDASGYAAPGGLAAGFTFPSNQENIAATIGGVESEMLLSNTLTNQILLSDTLHYRQGMLYLVGQTNLLLYLGSTRFHDQADINPNNDLIGYVNGMNYEYNSSGSNGYTIKKLSNQSLVSLLNPMQFYSAYSILYNYGIKAQNKLPKIPMIRIGKLRYLPVLNYSLTPFGGLFHFVNHLRYKRSLFTAEFNLGDNTFTKFYGFSLKGFNIADNRWLALNVHADVWSQPNLILENSDVNRENKIGGLFKVDLMLRPFVTHSKAGLFVQAGYKTKGYQMGELLRDGLILRYGISLRL